MSIRFVAQRELVKSLQAGGMDANGQKPERHISPRWGFDAVPPLADINEGAPYLVLAHRAGPHLPARRTVHAPRRERGGRRACSSSATLTSFAATGPTIGSPTAPAGSLLPPS